jgi:endonuclease/exonuclease/phosphatase family metal-dependent hydrolase
LLRVLTLNIWGRRGPADQRMVDFVAYLSRKRHDLVAMQEVEGRSEPTQAHQIASAAGYASVIHTRTATTRLRGEGLAVLTDLEATPVETVHLPSSFTDHARAMQVVDVALPSGEVVRIGNTHLAWRPGATELRVLQAERIREEFAGWTGPAIVLGDLNDAPGSRPLEVLTSGGGFVDCYADVSDADEWTFHPRNPFVWQPRLLRRRVDHVLARGFDVLDAAVVLTGEDAPIVSDHFGVEATLQLAG